MSKYAVIALGVVLVVAGSVSIWQGYDIIQVERGWTQVIAGATSLSAGVVTIAIGLLIGAVDRMRRELLPRDIVPATLPRAVTQKPAAPAAPSEPAHGDLVETHVDMVETKTPDPLAALSREFPMFSRKPEPDEPAVADAPLFRLPTASNIAPPPRPGAWIDEALAEKAHAGDPAPPVWSDALPHVQHEDAGSSRHDLALEGEARHAVDEPPAPPPLPATKVVGRYSFGGANYVLYNDGSVDAQTSDGVKRFTSLAELRAHTGRAGA